MFIVKRKAEYRTLPAEGKGLEELRIDLMNEMESLVNSAKAETRALTDDENNRFNEIKKDIESIDNTVNAIEEQRALESKTPIKKQDKEQRTLEEEKFVRFIKGEERALDVANNGGIIPSTIANKIIEKVKELSPIYSMATVYNVSGDLIFPVYDEESSSIGAAYVDDMQELTEGTGKFTTLKLENFIVGCLAKISKSLINRNDFDLVGFVVNKVAKAIADFLEKELIQGTPGKMQGVYSTDKIVTSENSTKIATDDLIDLQMNIPEIYQAKACWIMHKDTLKTLRKLKDNDGNYILGTALGGFGYILLGKPVHITENAEKIVAGKIPVVYGDMSGIYIKFAQNVEIQVLMEKYATQHAIGVVGYVECDSKIIEKQKIAALKMKVGA